MDMTAEEYLEKNTEYTGNEYDVFHIIDIAKFMNDFASLKTKELKEENKRLKSKVGILQRLSDRQKSTIIKWIEEYNIPPIKSGLDPTLDIFNQH